MNSSTREAQELAKLPDRRPTAEAQQFRNGDASGYKPENMPKTKINLLKSTT
ncbi:MULTISPECIES: hypothetical protein [unclassified Variovorax]|uniref:hypothetical protein n=1 Tax=unclassified Variovorax TaxID=663243 RepID=UPI003F46159E